MRNPAFLVAPLLALACSSSAEPGHAGSGGAAGAAGTAGGASGSGGAAGGACTSRILATTTGPERSACTFAAGDHVDKTLGLSAADRGSLPIDHLIIVMNENRSFDHYLGQLPVAGKADVDGWPAGFSNPDGTGASVAPFHLSSPCLDADPPHQWDAMHADYADGAMNGFVGSAASATGGDGHFVLGYYEEDDIPFYYWLAKTFAMSDRHFASVMSGTWPNREYLYAATSHGGHSTGDDTMGGVPTIFDAMTAAGVDWGVYANGMPRQDCLGWSVLHEGTHFYPQLLTALADGSLPSVSFVDPSGSQDEHPANNIHGGESWMHDLYQAAVTSPLWPGLAIVLTYDEAGGLADHVPPPPACIPSPDQGEFNRLGFRVPLFVISPYARAGYVSHVTHEHTSILRLLELLHDLPAMTARDANADALLDLFDFGCPALLTPPAAPDPATGSCN